MTKRRRKVDIVWEALFEKYNILEKIDEHGTFEVSAKQIREFGVPRLVVKFDHHSQLPDIFSENEITILPNTRGTYILGRFEVYKNVKYEKDIVPKKMSFPPFIHSIDANEISSESGALHAAYVSGMIDDFIGEKTIPTVSGRMSSRQFNFFIRNNDEKYIEFELNNSQVEIDAGYESKNSLVLCEAKNHRIDDFHIRQMYYPYRLFKEKNIGKEIRNIFFTYSNDIFSFFEYDFEDLTKYNSLTLQRQSHYMLAADSISKDDIYYLLKNVKLVYEPKEIPFPQADTFNRIIDLCTLLLDGDLTIDEITTNYDFNKRQSDYYQNGAQYLNLIEKYQSESEIFFTLTDEGREIMTCDTRNKFLLIADKILSHKPFRDALKLHFQKTPRNFDKISLTKKEIVTIMKSAGLTYSDVTLGRRASSIRGWINWILNIEKLLDK